jgi:RNA polymerase sigma factor (sigma-70 family)
MSNSDINLIRKVISNNDHRAFGILIDRHQYAIRNLLFKLAKGDKSIADDLSQEVFIRVFKHLKTFKETARFSTWLYRITLNVYYDHQKRLNYQNTLVLSEPNIENDSIDDKIDLLNALELLNEREKLAVVLNYEKGFSHNEISKIMKLPVGTVKTHILRGKAKLKKYFTDDRKR